jgi:cytochrome c oxidase subunit 2
MLKNLPLFPESASTVSDQVDLLYFALLGMTAFFSLLIAVAVVYLAVRYHRQHPDQVGHAEHENATLELVWSIIPLAIVIGLFFWGAKVYFTLGTPPDDAVTYYVTGKQWMWKIQHPEGNREINELHVPVGQAVKLVLASEDVLHAFYVPEFRIKMDAVPGRYRTMWFEATKVGTFHLFCAEYCGAEHSRMIGKIVVMSPPEYEAWLAGGKPDKTMAASGADLFNSLACNTCHRPDSSARAPQLVGLYGSTVAFLDGGTSLVDDNYVRESILDPAKHIVVGYNPIMPTFRGQVTEEELHQLLLYIKSLGPAAGGTPAAAASQTAAGTTR